jgi:predicted small secreted protein
MLIMMKKLMLVLVALAIGSPVLLTGCNTVQGAGRDIEKAGDKLQSEAAEHKRY